MRSTCAHLAAATLLVCTALVMVHLTADDGTWFTLSNPTGHDYTAAKIRAAMVVVPCLLLGYASAVLVTVHLAPRRTQCELVIRHENGSPDGR